jgi:hypothetical protein
MTTDKYTYRTHTFWLRKLTLDSRASPHSDDNMTLWVVVNVDGSKEQCLAYIKAV